MRKLRDGWDPGEEAVQYDPNKSMDDYIRSVTEWEESHQDQIDEANEFWMDVRDNVYDHYWGRANQPEVDRILKNNGTVDDVVSYALKYYGFDDTPENEKYMKQLITKT